MEDGNLKQDAEASSSAVSDSPEANNVLSESGANSGSSASHTSSIGNNYYIFLSFRGADTRKGFVDHLYHELVDAGLHHPDAVFRDDEKLRFGEPIAENLLSAINHSKVSIPVISKNYAASEWCLREIIQIMECVRSGKQKVYPVLYKVTPSDVRNMGGKFGCAFRWRKHTFDKEVKQKGPEALKKALADRIFESNKMFSGHEGKLVKELVQVIMGDLQHDFLLPLPGNLVGIDDHVANVMKLVHTNPSKTQIIGICGIGGIGKTTLATNIYNKLSNKFGRHSFLMDIRETINRKGMDHIQSLLLSDITKNHESSVRDPMTGSTNTQFSFKDKKVLILLDDVGHRDNLNKLIGGCNFESGSIIIITCRDKDVLKFEYEIYELKIYELEELNSNDSMLLLSSFAFEPKQPPTQLGTLPRDIVATIGGLPLALKIIGSFLKGKHQGIWTETLEKLKKVPHTDVQQKLRISYDLLEYEQQQMFLDIACFFIGTKKKIAAYLWKDLQYCPDSGLERMIEMSLMEIDDEGKLRMHDQLRDLGKAIACPANKKLWKCSRLWDEKAITVQRSKEENRYIEALRLDENGSNVFMERRSFTRMPYLKFLHLSKVHFAGDLEESLSELRWLEWKNCPNSLEAINVHSKKLITLDLSNGNICENWGGWNSIEMKRLKVLNLFECIKLKRTPNLSAFESLEILILEECYYLEEIDPSIGYVKCLVSLNLSGCTKLQKLPQEMHKLKELKELIIDGVRIEEIPSWIGYLKKLEILRAQGCKSLVRLPDSFSNLVNLSTLDLKYCPKLEKFPDRIGSLVKLQRVLLGNWYLPYEKYQKFRRIHWYWDEDYYCFHDIPHSIGELKLLTELRLTFTKISGLPESIGDLESLKILNIAGCTELSSLPGNISKLDKLEELDASACKSLGGKVSINGLSSLKILRLGKLSYINDLFMRDAIRLLERSGPSSRQHLDLTNCDFPDKLSVLEVTCQNCTLPQLSHLINLKELKIQFCELLESIPMLPSGILKLGVSWCCKLKELPSLLSLKLLSELSIQGCNELIEINGLEGLKSLGNLSLGHCNKLSNLKGLEQLESLRNLDIKKSDAPIINDDAFQVQCPRGLKSLDFVSIVINYCHSLERLDISQLTHLKELSVYNCKSLVEIKCHGKLKNLNMLDIARCDSIEIIPPPSLLDNLNYVQLEGCPKLRDVQAWRKSKPYQATMRIQQQYLYNLSTPVAFGSSYGMMGTKFG